MYTLSETKKEGKGNQKMEDYILFYSRKPKNERATSGVGLLVHKILKETLRTQSILMTDYCKPPLHSTLVQGKQQIICVYAPDISKSQDEKNAFYDDLQRTLDKIARQNEIIILGDFNARIGSPQWY